MEKTVNFKYYLLVMSKIHYSNKTAKAGRLLCFRSPQGIARERLSGCEYAKMEATDRRALRLHFMGAGSVGRGLLKHLKQSWVRSVGPDLVSGRVGRKQTLFTDSRRTASPR